MIVSRECDREARSLSALAPGGNRMRAKIVFATAALRTSLVCGWLRRTG
jgi:hypothetical protein